MQDLDSDCLQHTHGRKSGKQSLMADVTIPGVCEQQEEGDVETKCLRHWLENQNRGNWWRLCFKSEPVWDAM